MTYRLDRAPGVEQSLERLTRSDPDGARLLATAILGLAENPRPDGVHELSREERLYRLHLSRLDQVSRRTLGYRLLYRVVDEQVLVIVITAGAVPTPSRRR